MIAPSARRDELHVWTDQEVSELLWTACALRHRRDLPAEQFWAAVECFGFTGQAFESRLLRQAGAVAFAREYARALRFSTQSTPGMPAWPPPMTALELGLARDGGPPARPLDRRPAPVTRSRGWTTKER